MNQDKNQMESSDPDHARAEDKTDFLAEADAPQQGLVAEFVEFLRFNKKWWLTPILVVLGLIAGLVILTSTGGAPFIYALF